MKPMLASPPKKDVDLTIYDGWIADHKLDGLRCMVTWDASTRTLVLTNRNEVDITRQFPDIEHKLTQALIRQPWSVVLDGELVCTDGLFNSIATRGKQVKPVDIAASMRRLPADFVCFDILQNNTDLTRMPLVQRRIHLDALLDSVDRTITKVVTTDDPAMLFLLCKRQGLEGIIAKHPSSKYVFGSRCREWVKVKAVQSITCVAVGYEPGQGARADFGAAYIVVLDGATPVQVGKVGTGFKQADITWLKGELDAGRPTVVEIECLNRSKDNQLRFPVYKGPRTDQSVHDATFAQLDNLPIA